MITIKKRKLTKKPGKSNAYEYLVKVYEHKNNKLSNELNEQFYNFHEVYDGLDTANNYW